MDGYERDEEREKRVKDGKKRRYEKREKEAEVSAKLISGINLNSPHSQTDGE